MRRTLVVALSIFALASSAHAASAQQRAVEDSVSHSPVDSGPAVDTSAHKWTGGTMDGRVRAGCVGRPTSPVSYLLPVFCIQTTGVLNLVQFDSAVVVPRGMGYQIWASNAGGVPLLNRQKKQHALSGALIGGGLGLAAAAFGSVNSGAGFGSHALILGGAGAVIGAFAGSKYWADWPRVLRGSR